MRRLLLVVALAGCGRIAFDPVARDAGGADAAADGPSLLGCAGSRGPILDLADPRLVSYWTFDEGTIPVPDHGPANLPLTLVSGLPVASQPGFGVATSLNIGGGSVGANSVALSPGLGDFTVEAWMIISGSPCSTQSNWVVIGQFFELGCDVGGAASFSQNDRRLDGPMLQSAGWHHLAGVRRGNTVELWFDGMLAAADLVTPQDVTGSQFVGVGPLGGFVDEVAYWNAALAPDEIARHASYAFPGMLLYMPFDTGFVAPGIPYPAGTNGGVSSSGGRAGNGQAFNGVFGEIDVAMMPDQNADFTATAWFRTTDNGALQTIFHRDPASGSPDQIRLALDGSQLVGSVRNGDTTEVSFAASQSFVDGCWHHVALTRTGMDGAAGIVRVYIDGVKLGETSGVFGSTTAPSDPLTIGYRLSGDPRPFAGTLDEVETYNRALSDAEIARLFTTLQ